MIKEAIEKIESMAAAVINVVENRTYSNKPVHPVMEPSPKVLALGTLTGLRDYLSVNVDELAPDALILHIHDYKSVSLISRLKEPWRDRDALIHAECDTFKFPFGQFMDVENFIIRMQSQFVQDENTAAILKIVGNVTDSIVKQFNDDGVTQQATVKAGVSRVENIAIPNPVTLAPFRTFLEIEQPDSKFVFRMRSGNEAPACALFEADGGVWKNTATLRIKEWLTEQTKDIAIIA